MTDDPLRVIVVTAARTHEVTTPLRRTDCEVAAVEIDQSAGFVARNSATVRCTRQAIGRTDPDVVLLDASALIGCLAALVATLAGVPFVYRFKGDNYRTLVEKREVGATAPLSTLVIVASLALNRITYALAAGFVVVSEELKADVVDRLGCDPDRVRVVHVPVDSDRFDPGSPVDEAIAVAGDGGRRGAFPSLDADTVILTVTNLWYRGKLDGTKTVLDGVRPILAEREDVAYVVAGAGRYHEEFLAYVDRTVDDPSVRERIHASGYLEDVDPLYARADVMAYVSHIDGYPNAVLEAQLAELPVVANNAHGMSEQITHGETGYLLDDPTPEAVTHWVDRALDEADDDGVGARARQRLLRDNDPAVIGRDLAGALRAILAAA
jgi:glycosyltransferase involved in cell wall biosynthesis